MRSLLLGLLIGAAATWAAIQAERRNRRQAAELRRAYADLAELRHEVEVLAGWYDLACEQVADAERRYDRLQRAVDGAGVLVVPGHALVDAGAAHKLFLN